MTTGSPLPLCPAYWVHTPWHAESYFVHTAALDLHLTTAWTALLLGHAPEPGMPDYPRSLLTRLRDKRAQTCVSLVKLEHEIGTPASANSRTSRTGRASRPSRRGKARADSQRKKPNACAWQKAAVAPKVSINPGRSLSSL